MSKNTNAPASGSDKSTLARILAIALAVVSIVALFLPVAKVFGNAFELQSTYLFNGLLMDGSKLLFLPIPAPANFAGYIAGLALYFVLAASLAAVVLCVIAAIKVKSAKCLLLTAVYLLAAAYTAYALSIVFISVYTTAKMAFDVYTLALAVVSVVAFFILALKKQGKKVWFQLLQYVLTFVVGMLMFGFVAFSGKNVSTVTNSEFVMIAALAIFALTFVYLVFGAIRMLGLAKKLDKARFIAELALAILACIVAMIGNLGNKSLAFTLVAIFVAAIQVAIAFKVTESVEEEEEEEEEEEFEVEEAEDPLDEFRMEEYAEAYAYEGGPVDGVEMAEEVNPTFQEVNGAVNTAGYDFYNCQSFDPFIATLSLEERNQFTEVFILKYRGTMPEIPDYVVGGDNTQFFSKIFIYLGQYRERIPNGLLTKMYQFSIKM